MNLKRAWKSVAGALIVVTTMGLTTASAAQRARVYVRVGPPAPVVEVRPAAPSRRHIWVPGFHRWDGRAYVWVPGAWQVPPRARARWARGHWAHDRRGYYFVDGRWR